MNVIGLFLLLFVVIGAAMGLFLIAGKANVHPVDSYGNNISIEQNNTTTAAMPILVSPMAALPWIALLVVVLILVAVFLWVKGGGGGIGGGYQGRS